MISLKVNSVRLTINNEEAQMSNKAKNDLLRVFFGTAFGVMAGAIFTIELVKISAWFILLTAMIGGLTGFFLENLNKLARNLITAFQKAKEQEPMFPTMIRKLTNKLLKQNRARSFSQWFWRVTAISVFISGLFLFFCITMFPVLMLLQSSPKMPFTTTEILSWGLIVLAIVHFMIAIISIFVDPNSVPTLEDEISVNKRLSTNHPLFLIFYRIPRKVLSIIRKLGVGYINKFRNTDNRLLFWNWLAGSSFGSALALFIYFFFFVFSLSPHSKISIIDMSIVMNGCLIISGIFIIISALFAWFLDFDDNPLCLRSTENKIESAKQWIAITFLPYSLSWLAYKLVTKVLPITIKFTAVYFVLAWDKIHQDNSYICAIDAATFSTMAVLTGVIQNSWLLSSVTIHVVAFAMVGGLFGVFNLKVVKPAIHPLAEKLRQARQASTT